jgi:PAS domain-containing protein
VERHYRVYSLSDKGSIIGAENREFESDDHALAHAHKLLPGCAAVEVWQSDRLVHRLVRANPGESSDEHRPPLALVALTLGMGGQVAPMADEDVSLLVREITRAWRLGLLPTEEATRRLGQALGEDAREIDDRIAAVRAGAGRAALQNPMQRFVLGSNIRRFERLLAEDLAPLARKTVEALLLGARRELALVEARQSGAVAPAAEASALAGRTAGGSLLAVFEGSAKPSLLLSPQAGLHIVDVNDAYAGVTGVTRRMAAGERVFDLFPDNPDQSDADGVSNLYASLRRVAETGRRDAMPLQRYDLREDDRFVERYWMLVNTPVFDGGGRLTHILNQVEDVTRHVQALAF